MTNPLRAFRIRFSTAHVMLTAAVIPLLILPFMHTRYERWSHAAAAVAALAAVVTLRGRFLTGWVGTVFAWLWRRRRPLSPPSESGVGAIVMPADHVAVRWEGGQLVALVELIPRPFTPTVVVDGAAHTDDVVDTRLVEQLLSTHCPDIEADIVSAGYRVARTAAPSVVDPYEQVVGSDPAPARRRTWVVLRADPLATRRSAQRRDDDADGLARYLVGSAVRIAVHLAGHGVDAACERSFDDYDHATAIDFEREGWSRIRGRHTYTAAYTAAGGPDVWWSAPADRTIARIRVAVGKAPRSTVLLTTVGKARRPRGFAPVSGGQRAAVQGHVMVEDVHWQLPVGSAGVLLGQTPKGYPVYLPFDDVDSAMEFHDDHLLAQFTVRAAAAGGTVTLTTSLRELAGMIGAGLGAEDTVSWPQVTTYLRARAGVDRVVLGPDAISTPRHRRLRVRAITPPADGRPRHAPRHSAAAGRDPGR